LKKVLLPGSKTYKEELFRGKVCKMMPALNENNLLR
jgi:hypothetical protein